MQVSRSCIAASMSVFANCACLKLVRIAALGRFQLLRNSGFGLDFARAIRPDLGRARRRIGRERNSSYRREPRSSETLRARAEGAAEVATWSTDTVAARERFSFWREVVCQTVLNVATEAPRERFQAQISGRSFATVRVAAFGSTGHEIVRSPQHTARFPEDNYLVSLQRHGQSRITQDGDAFVLDPGEIGLVD